MSLVISDRVVETSTTTGTGALTLAGAVAGYQRFSAKMSVGDTCYYSLEAVDANGTPTGDWETGIGTYSAANTLTRTTIKDSSNSGSVVTLATGTKRVFLTLLAAELSTLSNPYEGFGNLLSIAALTPLGGASANITLTNYTKAHKYLWSASGANTVQLATMAAPATPWALHLRFMPSAAFGVNTQFGLILRNSSSAKITLFAFNSGSNLSVQEWTNPTTFSAQSTALANQSIWWLKINNDGTTLTFYVSVNGVDWELFYTRTLAAFMSSVDQVGLGGVPQVAGGAWVSDFGFVAPA